MSLSRVIKQEELKDHRICSVDYELLVGAPKGDEEDEPFLEGEGFKPLFFNECIGPHVPGREEADGTGSEMGFREGEGAIDPVAEGMLIIAEDEVKLQVADAYARGLEEGRLAAERGLDNVFKAFREGVKELIGLPRDVIQERFRLNGDEGVAYSIVGFATRGVPACEYHSRNCVRSTSAPSSIALTKSSQVAASPSCRSK